jgi:hypothetical protein
MAVATGELIMPEWCNTHFASTRTLGRFIRLQHCWVLVPGWYRLPIAVAHEVGAVGPPLHSKSKYSLRPQLSVGWLAGWLARRWMVVAPFDDSKTIYSSS